MDGPAHSASWLDALSRSERPSLVARLRAWLGCGAAAEDAVQDALLRLAAAGVVPDRIGDPNAYLARVARNAAHDRLRHPALRAGGPAALSPQLPCPAPDPEQAAAARQRAARFAVALSRLTPRQRAMLVAARIHGRSHAEIASRHGTTPDAVEKVVARALRRLAEDVDET